MPYRERIHRRSAGRYPLRAGGAVAARLDRKRLTEGSKPMSSVRGDEHGATADPDPELIFQASASKSSHSPNFDSFTWPSDAINVTIHGSGLPVPIPTRVPFLPPTLHNARTHRPVDRHIVARSLASCLPTLTGMPNILGPCLRPRKASSMSWMRPPRA